MKKNHMVKGALGLAFFFVLICFVFAQDQAQKQAAGQPSPKEPSSDKISKEEKYTSETASGEVSAIGKNYISIVTNRDYDAGTEEEVMIPITGKTAFKHVNNLKQIKRGDLVSVDYEKPAPGYSGTANALVISFIQSGAGAGLVSNAADNAGQTP